MLHKTKEIRIGVLAVHKGYATAEQIIKALEIQVKEDLSIGKHRRIGVILLEEGVINITQLNEILQSLDQTE